MIHPSIVFFQDCTWIGLASGLQDCTRLDSTCASQVYVTRGWYCGLCSFQTFQLGHALLSVYSSRKMSTKLIKIYGN